MDSSSTASSNTPTISSSPSSPLAAKDISDILSLIGVSEQPVAFPTVESQPTTIPNILFTSMSTEADISDMLSVSNSSNATTPTRTSSSGSLDTIDSILNCNNGSLLHSPGNLEMNHSPHLFFNEHPSSRVITSIEQSQSFPLSNAMSFPILSSSPTLTTTANNEMSFTVQPLEGRRVLRPARSAPHPYIPRNPSSRVLRRNSSASTALTTFGHKPSGSNTRVLPAIDQNGQYKFCDNCITAVTPSWRRHPETQKLLCNACGLYLRLHRRARPITLDDSGQIQVIRKNAAVQREPINMLQRPTYSSRIPSQHGNVGLAFNYMPQQPSSQPILQANTTTLSGLQGMDNHHLLTGNSQHMNGLSITSENERLIPGMVDNMLQLNIVDNRMAMSPVHSDMGWLQDVYSSHQNIPSPDTKPDDIQSWSEEGQKH